MGTKKAVVKENIITNQHGCYNCRNFFKVRHEFSLKYFDRRDQAIPSLYKENSMRPVTKVYFCSQPIRYREKKIGKQT